MGQAFRRAAGRIRASSSVETTPSASKPSSFADSRPPVAPAAGEEISKTVEPGGAPGSGKFQPILFGGYIFWDLQS